MQKIFLVNAMLVFFGFATNASATTLTCEGKISNVENVTWSIPTISMELTYTQGMTVGELSTSDEMLGNNVALYVNIDNTSLQAFQTNRREQGGNIFGITAMTISRGSGKFVMMATLETKQNPVPKLSVTWTGSCIKASPANNKF